MSHFRSARSVVLPAALVAGLAASVLPATGVTVSAYAADVTASLVSEALAPTALTLHAGRADQEFGHVLNSGVCDVDGDDLTDVTATGAVALGTTQFRDMAAQRRVDGHADALTDLPQWTNWTTNGRGGFTCAGDVNADGFDDLVEVPLPTSRFVAVEQSAGVRNAAGRLVQNRVQRYTFPAGSSQLGAHALGSAGDVDADGLGDVLVSQHTASVGLGATARSENGRLWVLRGQAAATVPAGVTLRTLDVARNAGTDVAIVVTGAATGDRLGAAVPLGDVTGDGFDDLAVASEAGTVWLVAGKAPTVNTREIDLAQLDASDGRVLHTGTDPLADRVTDLAVGDLDGDDRTDLVIGHGTESGAGSVTVLSDVAGPATARSIAGEQAGDEFGHAVAVVGDLDGNGSDDLLVGAPGRNAGTGAAYVLSGTHTSAVQGHRIDGTRGDAQASDRASRFGSDVAAVGDVDGNGALDYAISAPGRSEHPTYRQGAVTVALNGELGAQLALAAARRVGDDGVPVLDGDVLKASDVVDVRTNLRLATQQGVAGEVALVVDGADAATATTSVSAPHRAFAFFDDVTLPVGEHTLAVRSDAVAGLRAAATTSGPTVLVTDETRTSITVADGALEARVVTATDGTPVAGGTVTFVGVDGSVIAADIPVVGGVARTDVAPGTGRGALTGARAEFAGVETTFRGDDIVMLARSSAAVAPVTAPKATVKLSTTSARRGDAVRATLTLDRVVTSGVTVLVDGKVVGSARVDGRSVTVALPRLLTVGARTVTVRTVGTDDAPAAQASARLSVTRATSGAVKAVAKKFTRGTKPKVTVTVGRASDGTQPVGTVRVTVAGKKVTAKVTAAKKGKVVVTLPKRRKAATAKVTFTPAATGTFTTPKTARVKLTPRR